jgi:hypothetical protein
MVDSAAAGAAWDSKITVGAGAVDGATDPAEFAVDGFGEVLSVPLGLEA